MEPNTDIIKGELKNEVEEEILAEGSIFPAPPPLPPLIIPAIEVIAYYQQAAGLLMHSKIKFRQTVDIKMPIKVKLSIPKAFHQHLFGLNPILIQEDLAGIIYKNYLKKVFKQQSYAVIQTPILIEWKTPKSAQEYSKITFNYIVYNDIGRQQWPWELPTIGTLFIFVLSFSLFRQFVLQEQQSRRALKLLHW